MDACMVLRLWAYLPKKREEVVGLTKAHWIKTNGCMVFKVVGLFTQEKKKEVVGLAIQLTCPLVLILGKGLGLGRDQLCLCIINYSITTVGFFFFLN